MKRLIALMLVVCLILCGCGSSDSGETSETTEESTTETTEETTEEATVETTEQVITYTHPLTGVTLAEECTARPIAIMINNAKAALPHHGISQADIVYETCVEGGMTRFMAIFTDRLYEDFSIGSIRSARPPFVSVAQSYNAIYSSAQGDDVVIDLVRAANLDYLNALASNSYFYRNKDRLNKVALEHTMFIESSGLLGYANSKGYSVTQTGYDYGLNFDDSAEIGGEAASKVTIYFTKGGKSTIANYNESLGGYTLYQLGTDYIDGNTGEKVVFRNVLVLTANKWTFSDGKHIQMDLVGSGSGWMLRDGKLVEIKWTRKNATDPFTYTYADGSEAALGVGSTYVAVISNNSTISVG